MCTIYAESSKHKTNDLFSSFVLHYFLFLSSFPTYQNKLRCMFDTLFILQLSIYNQQLLKNSKPLDLHLVLDPFVK